MRIAVLGLNHKTAPLKVREQLALDAEETITALRQLKSKFNHAEFVLLSTCNRIEVYWASPIAKAVEAPEVAEFLAAYRSVPRRQFQEFLYVHNDEDAVRHLLTVASSLDSMVVGEAQIIGQVKESYRLACMAKSTGKVLNHLFHVAFSTSKKVHTATSISSGRVSVAGVAVQLAKQLFSDISSARVVVIGAGEMGELLVQHLLQVKCKNITIVNRSYERGADMAERHHITARPWEELTGLLNCADIAIASATAQDYLFAEPDFRRTIDRRGKGALLIIDVAVPRNFEPSINQIEDVYLYSIDDLSEAAEHNLRAREDDMAKGMEIIAENVSDFMDWFSARDIGPLIGQMRERFQQIGQDELQRFFTGVRREASCKQVAESMVNRIVNKIVHCVIKNVNTVAEEHGPREAAKLADSIVRQAEKVSLGSEDETETE